MACRFVFVSDSERIRGMVLCCRCFDCCRTFAYLGVSSGWCPVDSLAEFNELPSNYCRRGLMEEVVKGAGSVPTWRAAVVNSSWFTSPRICVSPPCLSRGVQFFFLLYHSEILLSIVVTKPKHALLVPLMIIRTTSSNARCLCWRRP